MSQPLLIDGFCCEGGTTEGFRRAGFDVIGVDIEPQPNHRGEFRQMDMMKALEVFARQTEAGGRPTFEGREVSAIALSPPCQGYSTLRMSTNAKEHPKLIAPCREKLLRIGLPYSIENVQGARKEMVDPILLCGSMFGLGIPGYQLRRHRLFETSFDVPQPSCAHSGPTVGIYGDHLRGTGHYVPGSQWPASEKVRLAREALGIDWMDWAGLRQAIPPDYTAYIGGFMMAAVEQRQTKRGLVLAA